MSVICVRCTQRERIISELEEENKRLGSKITYMVDQVASLVNQHRNEVGELRKILTQVQDELYISRVSGTLLKEAVDNGY